MKEHSQCESYEGGSINGDIYYQENNETHL